MVAGIIKVLIAGIELMQRLAEIIPVTIEGG